MIILNCLIIALAIVAPALATNTISWLMFKSVEQNRLQ